jgi:hypothetical protein
MDVPIKPRDFLRRHPEMRRGYSVAQPFLGVPVMPDPNQPNPQQQPTNQAQAGQPVAGIDFNQLQTLFQSLQKYGPVVFQFLQVLQQHLQPTPQPAPIFGAGGTQQDPIEAWLEGTAFQAAQAMKAKVK